jgi:hypothetical protein
MSNPFGYVENMPYEIRDVFMWLCQDVASLNDKWSTYKGLYSDSSVTDLLSYIAKHTFRTIEESLRNDMTMSICRLCDPLRSSGFENVSFSALLGSEIIPQNIKEDIKIFAEFCEPVKSLRNKRVAHNDKNTMLNPKENPLPGISIKQIDNIVSTAERILNLVLSRYESSEMDFEAFDPGTANELVFHLRQARASSLRREPRYRGGDDEEDL